MISFQSKLPDVGTTIFTLMSRMAQEHGAINLSQGFPDFPVDPEIISLVEQYMASGHNQYAQMAGAPALRQALSSVIAKTYNHTVDAESEITVTAGATQAIYSVIATFISSGDEVIVFDPAYDSYGPAIRLNGGVPVHINLKFPEFSIDWAEVRARITPRTKMIMINTPHNPCGVVLHEQDLLALQRIASAFGLIVLSDEVYERLIFEGCVHQSVLRFPELAVQSIAIFSFGKTFHATGWKVGYMVGPCHLMNEIRKAHQYIVFSVNTPIQLALAEYLANPLHYENLALFYQRKRDFFLDNLKGSSFQPFRALGSYFQILSYKNISSLPDTQMAEELTKKFKVASIPVSVFYQDGTDNKLLRFCFAKKEETLFAACEILRKL